MASIFGSKFKSFMAMSIPPQDEPLTNRLMDFAKPVKAIFLPQDVPGTFDRSLIELENQVQCLMEAHLALKQPVQVNKITSSCEIYRDTHDTKYCMENLEKAFVQYASSQIGAQQPEEPEQTLEEEFKDLYLNLSVLEVLAHAPMYSAILDKYTMRLQTFDTLADLGSCVNIISLYLFKKLNIGLLEETGRVFGLADGTKSYPVRIIRDVEVHLGRLKFLNYFYVIDMKKDPETPLLMGREFLATANAIIDCKKAKIAVGEGITRKEFMKCHLPREWDIARDGEINPFKDVLVFRRMDKPPKSGDRAWHAKIRIIDSDGEEFTKTF
nr:hypothetical protein [Tanacetum cinerariifolium]